MRGKRQLMARSDAATSARDALCSHLCVWRVPRRRGHSRAPESLMEGSSMMAKSLSGEIIGRQGLLRTVTLAVSGLVLQSFF